MRAREGASHSSKDSLPLLLPQLPSPRPGMKGLFVCLFAVPLACALPQQPGSLSVPISRRSPNPSVDAPLFVERLRRTRDKYGMVPAREVLAKRAGTAASVKLAGSDL